MSKAPTPPISGIEEVLSTERMEYLLSNNAHLGTSTTGAFVFVVEGRRNYIPIYYKIATTGCPGTTFQSSITIRPNSILTSFSKTVKRNRIRCVARMQNSQLN
jgi:hypothetical protein